MKINNRKVKTAIFPVGGLGTRFLPVTKSMPKEMLPIVNKPLIQYAFEEAKEAGIEKFIFVTGRNKNAINNHFDYAYELQENLSIKNKKHELNLTKDWLPDIGSIAFVRQQEPLGLGHAIWSARKFINEKEPFLVILADEMTANNKGNFLQKMINCYEENVNIDCLVALAKIDIKDSVKYGMIKKSNKDNNNESYCQIIDMIEKPKPENSPSDLSIIGKYILAPEIFDILDNSKKTLQGEIQLTDAMKSMLKSKNFYGFEFKGKRFDCGSPLGYLEANLFYALEDKKISKEFKRILHSYVDR